MTRHIARCGAFYLGERMNIAKLGFAGVLAVLVSVNSQAGQLTVSNAWARATAPGQDSAMVQLVITSKRDAKLIGASSKAAQSAELHSMVHEQGVMKMRQVDVVELPAGKALDLGEAGYHLMLLGLKKPLKSGEKFALTLNVRHANGKEQAAKVTVVVKPLTESVEHEHSHHP